MFNHSKHYQLLECSFDRFFLYSHNPGLSLDVWCVQSFFEANHMVCRICRDFTSLPLAVWSLYSVFQACHCVCVYSSTLYLLTNFISSPDIYALLYDTEFASVYMITQSFMVQFASVGCKYVMFYRHRLLQ